MKPVRDIDPVRVPAHAVHGIAGAQGLQVTVIDGMIWLTQAGDPRDVILTRGQSFILDRKGLALVYGLKDSAIIVGPVGHISVADFTPPAAYDGPA